jgi:DNA (cytosine-5)-methyltransferase 1
MGQTPAAGVDQPSNTITAKNDRALVVPHLVSVAHSTTTGRGKYFDSVEEPLKTVTQSNDKALVTPYLVPMTHGGERRPNSIEEPLPTITTAHRGEIGLIAPVLTRQFGNSIGQRVDQPSPTQTCGEKTALVAAFLAKHFGGVVGHVPDRPLGTVTTIDHHSLVAANLIRMNHGDKQWNGVNEPLVTQTTANHAALVYSFLIRYFGTAIGQSVTEPLFTITGKDRFGLVTVSIDGELYVIVDIGMRMLAPRELARAQGFDDSYKLTGTKTSQVARIGNSVPPVMAEVLVNANYVTEAACQ